MPLETLRAKEELRDLIDAYAYLGDEKNPGSDGFIHTRY
ncbi:hypothetical protein FLAT13_04016 [Flavobacterium salmonis]|uniref:Uncharacterized protein n=1 Tax=Flavobacterium salmonis TaxID=2654844 RepID=A0A6V6Z8I6_9FLAO|nr:hypothetical protein FLAT13_04016 [Flavobacterium salmonis]